MECLSAASRISNTNRTNWVAAKSQETTMAAPTHTHTYTPTCHNRIGWSVHFLNKTCESLLEYNIIYHGKRKNNCNRLDT